MAKGEQCAELRAESRYAEPRAVDLAECPPAPLRPSVPAGPRPRRRLLGILLATGHLRGPEFLAPVRGLGATVTGGTARAATVARRSGVDPWQHRLVHGAPSRAGVVVWVPGLEEPWREPCTSSGVKHTGLKPGLQQGLCPPHNCQVLLAFRCSAAVAAQTLA
jgi:hypothetical protein